MSNPEKKGKKMQKKDIAFSSTSEPKTWNHAFHKRLVFLKGIRVACSFGLALLLGAPNLAHTERNSLETTKGEKQWN